MKLRETGTGLAIIGGIVALGVWVASRPAALQPGGFLNPSELEEAVTPISSTAVRKISWSADGRRLLTVTHGEIGEAGPLILHNLDEGPRRVSVGPPGETIVSADLAADDRYALVATREGRLWWSGLESGEDRLVLELPGESEFSWTTVSPDGTKAAVAATDGSVFLIDPQSAPERNLERRLVTGPAVRTTHLKFSSDGRYLAAANYGGGIRLWDLSTGQEVQNWQGHEQPATSVAVLPEGRVLTASLDDTVRIWDANGKGEVLGAKAGLFGVTSMAVSVDGKTAAWGGHRRKIVVWDLETARKRFEISISASMVWDIKFSPDCQFLAVSGNDGTLQLYDARTGRVKKALEVG
ncbi:MAG: WD40 repeat domain-containing protein [Planctomycetes bacterium]|nr:WD40 repeat domain-containing protein [Planctomycetota bacterium]